MNLLYPDANKKMNIPKNPPFGNLIHMYKTCPNRFIS